MYVVRNNLLFFYFCTSSVAVICSAFLGCIYLFVSYCKASITCLMKTSLYKYLGMDNLELKWTRIKSVNVQVKRMSNLIKRAIICVHILRQTCGSICFTSVNVYLLVSASSLRMDVVRLKICYECRHVCSYLCDQLFFFLFYLVVSFFFLFHMLALAGVFILQ